MCSTGILRRLDATVSAALLILTSTALAYQAQPAIQVLSVSAGPTGVETSGSFALSEERSIFSRQHDKQILVLFRWEGTPGPHKLVAQWRSPDGGATSTSAIDYVAKERRFGAYWQLPISATMPAGMWTIDVTVDGQPAGRHTFEVREERVEPAVVKRILTQAELYDRLNGAFVTIEKTAGTGKPPIVAGGVYGDWGIYTAVTVLDGAAMLQARAADGSSFDVSSVRSIDRERGWAVLSAPARQASLPIARSQTLSVGDRCYSIEMSASGGRALSACAISGRLPGSQGNSGLVLRFMTGPGTSGAPVIDENGELIGLVSGSGAPGSPQRIDDVGAHADLPDAILVPAAAILVLAHAKPESLAALQESGVLLAPLVGDEHIVSGGFARRLIKSNVVTPADQKEWFALADKTFVVFVNWLPADRLRGMSKLRLYDPANRLLGESEPRKVDFRKGELSLSSWQLPLPSAPGGYRVEVLVNDKPIWRGTLRVRP